MGLRLFKKLKTLTSNRFVDKLLGLEVWEIKRIYELEISMMSRIVFMYNKTSVSTEKKVKVNEKEQAQLIITHTFFLCIFS